MARLTLWSPFVVTIILFIFIIVCGSEFQNKKFCPKRKSNATFGQRQPNDTLLWQQMVKKGIPMPNGKTFAKLDWVPQTVMRPTFIKVVDKSKLCECNNTLRVRGPIDDYWSKIFTGMEISSGLGCPINAMIELWGHNETEPHSIDDK